jgi:DNA-directed RNA polymerase subunit M
MKFCPKCGSICLPKKEGTKTVFACKCGHSEAGETKITETMKHEEKKFGVAEENIDTLPVVKTRCPNCGYGEAANWEIQTRSPDEAATQFFKCKKCSHTWREYR